MSALKDHCFSCFTRDGGIIFDSQTDRYYILTLAQTELIQQSLFYGKSSHLLPCEIRGLFHDNMKNFQGDQVCSSIADGIHDYIWRYIPFDSASYARKSPVLRYALWVYFIQLGIKTRGIVNTLTKIGKVQKVLTKLLPQRELPCVADQIMTAARLSPFRFECLEFAIAMRCYAEAKGYKNTKFCLGVQRFPFLAHAWVEHDGIPIGDAVDLRDRAAIIFEM
ncbi:lasso peptide biosynthesis B2 protein [Ochrobactrum sp. GPK 3]|uniref:lasso peptide biosynthesis B2 protein n=1 Tax=Brucella sp. 22210 TaxID=3453892 RepID=UPI0031385BEF